MNIEKRIRVDRANGRAPIYISLRPDDCHVISLQQASSRIFCTAEEFDALADAVDALTTPQLGEMAVFEVGSDDT